MSREKLSRPSRAREISRVGRVAPRIYDPVGNSSREEEERASEKIVPRCSFQIAAADTRAPVPRRAPEGAQELSSGNARERPIRFQWTHFNRGHCIRISLRYAMIYGSLHVLVAVAREKKPLPLPLSKKLRVDRAPSPSAKRTNRKGSYRRSLYFVSSRSA